MRPPVDAARLNELAAALGAVVRAPTKLYLTGGASAVIEGWRESTVDVDVRFEPEADELFGAIPDLKERLGLNIELASPPDFIPELPGWRERSPMVLRTGMLEVRHFDFYSQALSKIERGFAQDLSDVRSMIDGGKVELARLVELYRSIEPKLLRYPAIDRRAFARKVEDIAGGDMR